LLSGIICKQYPRLIKLIQPDVSIETKKYTINQHIVDRWLPPPKSSKKPKISCPMKLKLNPMVMVNQIMSSQPICPQYTDFVENVKYVYETSFMINLKLVTTKPLDIDPTIGKILIRQISAFQVIDGPLGRVIGVEHSITLSSDKPIKMKQYRYSPGDSDFLKESTDLMQEQGLIKLAESSYSAPVIVVHTPFRLSQPRRLVIDYRALNAITLSIAFHYASY